MTTTSPGMSKTQQVMPKKRKVINNKLPPDSSVGMKTFSGKKPIISSASKAQRPFVKTPTGGSSQKI